MTSTGSPFVSLLLDPPDGLLKLLLGDDPAVLGKSAYNTRLESLVNILGRIVVVEHIGGECKGQLRGA
jgi:hypothetical protein